MAWRVVSRVAQHVMVVCSTRAPAGPARCGAAGAARHAGAVRDAAARHAEPGAAFMVA